MLRMYEMEIKASWRQGGSLKEKCNVLTYVSCVKDSSSYQKAYNKPYCDYEN